MQESSLVSLRAVEINPWEDSRWEAFVMRHPDGTIYHHPAWLKALECEYRQRTLFLACEDPDGVLLGILPLLYTRGLPLSGPNPITGPRLSSLPRTPLAGPLSIDPAATDELLREAVRRATAEPRLLMQIKTPGPIVGSASDAVVRKPWRMTYIVRLAGIPGQSYTVPDRENRSRIKRAINKGIANGVRTRSADSEADLRIWYGIYLETMRRNLVASRPYRFFFALWERMHSKGMMRLLLAENDTGAGPNVLAGYIFFTFGQTVTYAFGASRTSALPLRPNDILLWQAIQEASNEGYRFVDLGEVPEGDDDLARFKTKWGAEPVRLYRYYYPDYPDVEQSSTKTSSSPKKLASLIWRHMPLPITAWLGDRLYGYL